MPLTKRIIPCLDVTTREGIARVVKGTRFVNLRDAGDPVELGAFYDEQKADELVFLDITASSDDRTILIDMVERTGEQVFIPDTTKNETFQELLIEYPEKTSAILQKVKTAIYYPMKLGSKVVGVINIQSYRKISYSFHNDFQRLFLIQISQKAALLKMIIQLIKNLNMLLQKLKHKKNVLKSFLWQSVMRLV